MMRSLFSGVSGVGAHQQRMDVVGNNIANVNTIGYKKSNVTFQDTLSQTMKPATGGSTGNSIGGSNPQQIGTGVGVGSINTVHSQGPMATTGNKTDVMISGEGYFVLTDGATNYFSRAGAFAIDHEGYLVNSANGMYVLDDNESKIKIVPASGDLEDISNVSIASNGEVQYLEKGTPPASGTFQKIGLAKFANPAGLEKKGQNLYLDTANSGKCTDYEAPGTSGYGTLVSNALEMSNVDIAEEFSNMIITQRGFQANTRTIKVSDELLQDLVNLKR